MSDPKKVTKEDNEQINYIKKVITTVFASLSSKKSYALIAMTELIIYATAEHCKDQGDLNEAMKEYYEKVLIPSCKALGTSYIKLFQEMNELERKNPGTINAMVELQRANADVQVRMVHPDEMDNQPGVRVGGSGPITKH